MMEILFSTNDLPCVVVQITQTSDIKKRFQFKHKKTLFCRVVMRAKPINELRKELHVFAKGSFFNEGEYDVNKIEIYGNFYEYPDRYSSNVIEFEQNHEIQIPPDHYINPTFKTATQIVPFFT